MSLRLPAVFLTLAIIAAATACSREPAPAPATSQKRTVSKNSFAELRPAVVDRGAKKIATNKPGLRRVAVVKAVAPAAITPSGPVKGTLTSSDEQLDDGSVADFYNYAGTRGERLTITLRSKEFDVYLIVGVMRNGVFDPQDSDDDSAGNTDARLTLNLESTGPLVIAANALESGQSGAYDLEISKSEAPARASNTPPPADAPMLTFNSPGNGRLEASDRQLSHDKTHYDDWIFEGQAGQRVVITMRSDTLDSYLLLKRGSPGSSDFIAENDDSGGLNAQITATLPETGLYSVMANTAEPQTGAYTLLLERLAAATATADASGVPYAERYPGTGDPAEKYAVVVGIDKYPGTANNLDGPVADARLFRDVLVNRFGFKPQNVVTLNDANATRDHILKAIERHLGQAGPRGTAVFFYSGHGTQMPENLALTAPIDPEADERDEALFVWGTDDQSSIVLDDEIGYAIDQLKTDRVLFVHDSCNSGTSARGAGGGQPKEVMFSKATADASFMPRRFAVGAPPQRAGTAAGRGLNDILDARASYGLLSASKDDEVSFTASGWPDKGGVASVFTYYLVSTLEKAEDSMTFNQLMEKVGALSVAYTKKYPSQQTPQITGTLGTRTIGSVLR